MILNWFFVTLIAGKGLGKSLQGGCEPIEAQVRKGRGGVGKYFSFILIVTTI